MRVSLPRGASGIGPSAAALAFLLALLVLLFPGLALQGRVLFERDIALMWQPQVESFVHVVAAGSWPVWDPWVSFGRPLLANPNTQVLYPFTWLNLLVRPQTFFTLYVFAHLLLAGCGNLLLGRRLGLGRQARLLSAAAFAASGPLLSLVNAWNHLPGASLLPWACLAADTALASGRARHAVAWGAVLALQVLGGSPDLALFTALATGGFVAWRLALTRAAGDRLRLARVTLVAAVFALSLPAALALPALELARASVRRALPEGSRAVWSTHPLGLAELVSPFPWTELPLSDPARLRLYDGGEPFLKSLYVGVPVLALVLLSLAGGRRRGRALLLVLLGAFVLLALGRHTPFYDGLLALVPPLRSIRYPSKALVVAAFAISLLAGMGFDAWQKVGRPWLRAVSCAVLAVALLALGTSRTVALPGRHAGSVLDTVATGSQGEARLEPLATRLASSALLWVAFAGVTLLHARRPSRTSTHLALGLIALDLAVANRHDNPTAPADFYRYRPPILESIVSGDLSRLFVYQYPLRPAPPHPALATDNPYRIAWYPAGYDVHSGQMLAARLYPMPPAGAAFQLFGSFEPDQLGLYPRPLQALVDAFQRSEGTPAYRRLLAIGGVSRLVALHARGLEDLLPLAVYRSSFVLPVRLYGVPGALARTYVVGRGRSASDEEALRLLAGPDFDPSGEVLLAPGAPVLDGAAAAGSSRVVSLAPDRVQIAAELARPGYVVLLDGYDPGWQATVDGRHAAVLRANVAFRAVALDAGRHQVVLVYRPPSLRIGLAVSGGALLAGALVVARGRAKAVAHRPTS